MLRGSAAATRRDIAALADPFETELPADSTNSATRHAHRRQQQQFKDHPADR